MKYSMLLLTLATTGACSPVVLYTHETAPKGSCNDELMAEAQAKQPFLYSVLEQRQSWGTEQDLKLVVCWAREFSSYTWEGNIFLNMDLEITDTELGKVVFMEKMQEIYKEACRSESMRQAILNSVVWDFDLFTINHLLQSSILSFYPLLVDLLQALNTSFVKIDGLSCGVSGELCCGKASTYLANFEKLVKIMQQDDKFIYTAVGVYEILKLLVDYEPDLDTLRMVLSWGTGNVKDTYEWATSNLDKTTQALLVLPEDQYKWHYILSSIWFREPKSFPNLPRHLNSIKINSSELGREHLIMMLLFPEHSEELSLMVWNQGRPLRELFSILPLLSWQTELAIELNWELYWNRSVFLETLESATRQSIQELAQAWFDNILNRSICEGIGLKKISSIWRCPLSQPVILHQFYLRRYASQKFDNFILNEVRTCLTRLGSIVTNEDFSQEILFDEVLPKMVETDDPYVIFLLRVLLTKVFDEKKLARWIFVYVLTATELRMEQSEMTELILDEELAGPNHEVWLAEVFSILRLFVPDFVFDDLPYHNSVGELSTFICRQVNLPDSISLIRILKQQKGTSSFIPVISSKILAEIEISNAWIVEQVLTKLLRQTQLLDIENNYQNSSEILDNLYSRIDRSSFLRLNVLSLLDANLDPSRVDEIVRPILEIHGNSFIQTAMTLATLQKELGDSV